MKMRRRIWAVTPRTPLSGSLFYDNWRIYMYEYYLPRRLYFVEIESDLGWKN